MAIELAGWRHIYSGKVRDLYEPLEAELEGLLLVVATDRISAFDNVLEPEIPGKGIELTRVSNFWFDSLPIANHRIEHHPIPSEVKDRATVAKKLEMFPIECVVRGYLSGSGTKEYLTTGKICGISLPHGLQSGDRLPEPIFTPAFKADLGEHDENISYQEVERIVGPQWASELRRASLEIFAIASEIAERSGLILADTKFEFGRDPQSGELVLADEVLTPDSSRYWDRSAWENEQSVESFDKQIVRNWLSENWDPLEGGAPPRLPEEIVEQTRSRYAELRRRLTGTN